MEFDDSNQSKDPDKTLHTFELLRRVEFTSDRKRMSILLKDPEDGKIKLYVKGADSIIMERLNRDAVIGDAR